MLKRGGALRAASLAGCLCLVGALAATGAPTAPSEVAGAQAGRWLARRAQFYELTSFPLANDTRRLLGGRFAAQHHGHLPFWFDYQLYTEVFAKHYSDANERELRHHEFITSCVRVLKQRVLVRALAGNEDALLDRDADLFFEERIPAQPGEPAGAVPLSITVSLEPRALLSEAPLERALRLVQQELRAVESANLARLYLEALDDARSGSAIRKELLPY